MLWTILVILLVLWLLGLVGGVGGSLNPPVACCRRDSVDFQPAQRAPYYCLSGDESLQGGATSVRRVLCPHPTQMG